MGRDHNQYSQSQNPAPKDPALSEAAAALRDVLRQVTKEVTLPALNPEALAAVEYHKRVAALLAPNSRVLIPNRPGTGVVFRDATVSDPTVTQQKPDAAAV